MTFNPVAEFENHPEQSLTTFAEALKKQYNPNPAKSKAN